MTGLFYLKHTLQPASRRGPELDCADDCADCAGDDTATPVTIRRSQWSRLG